MNKFRLIWRWTLIIGWFALGIVFLVTGSQYDPETLSRMLFVNCLLLVGYNIEKVVDGK